jgi:LmbE family N-acetylglucosaminyl deacetylase
MLPAVESSIAILSPHLDDAVLSCWHQLAGPGKVAVINVFAGIPPAGAPVGWWDRLSGAEDARAVVEARRAEDRAALALAGREPINLDFLDRQYRPDAHPPPALADALREHLPDGALVLAPAAIAPMPDDVVDEPGEPHPDHVAVREAALALREDGSAVQLYADLPHASAGGWLAVPAGAEVHDLAGGAFTAKLRAVRRYATQIAVLEHAFGGRLDDSALLGREARWTP